ncbi:MAG: glycosyltransferase family 2 protein [Candidatus Aenigmarchaeota archaeon]|nr:glycosyltransferase family 2 protein [Candidatus Aenigmarchaeota archaeon]
MVDAVTVIILILSLPYWVSVFTILTHLKPGSVQKGKLPFVSVIIPTKNEENVIEKTLKKIKNSDYPGRMEIIVVDANSTDRTAKIARRYGRVIVERKPKGKPHALNLAMRKARGEIIYIIDADSWVEKDTIKNLILQMDGYKAVTGINLPENKNSFVTRFGRLENALLIDTDLFLYSLLKTAIVPGRNYAVYKNVLKKIGGFKNVLTEDLNISIRLYKAGYNVKLVPAKCYEQVPDRFRWYLKQQKRWSMGSINEIKNTIGNIRPILLPLIPVLMFLAMTFVAFTISLIAFLLTMSPVFLLILVPTLLVSAIAVHKYLEADDMYYLPLTAIALGILCIAINLYAFSCVVLRKKTIWEKTPKEKM